MLYGPGSDFRRHEVGRGTAFKTPWMNDVVYQITCFMIIRNSATWRWSHSRHHTDTIIVGRDVEIALMRPVAVARALSPFIGLPRLYGAWHFVMSGYLQHGGLADNVLDHRLNSRTVCMNPISRFIYWNMNYHIEHHMFPMVPYHRRPHELHERIKGDLPAPSRSITAACAANCPGRRNRIAKICIRRRWASSAVQALHPALWPCLSSQLSRRAEKNH